MALGSKAQNIQIEEKDYEKTVPDLPENVVITPANPIRYKLHDSDEIHIFPKQSKIATGSSPASSQKKAGRRTKVLPDEWIANWNIEVRQRPNEGRIDKFYYHKVEGFMCRSAKEVERFEKEGIRPKRSEKLQDNDKEQKNNKNKIEKLPVAERDAEAKEKLVIVERFLAEAYYNLKERNY